MTYTSRRTYTSKSSASKTANSNRTRRNTRRVEKKPRRKLPIGRVFKVGVILAVFGVIGFYAVKFSLDIYDNVMSSDYFLINRIDVAGNNNVPEEDILASAGVAVGQNNISVSIEEVETRLEKNPWLERVSVKRVLPDILEIIVQERVPRFWVLNEDGVMYYADQRGKPIAPLDTAPLQSLPVLEIEAGGERYGDHLPQMLMVFDRSGLPLSVQSAAWLKLTRAGGLEIYLEDSGLHLGLGAEDFTNNLVRLSLVLRDLNKRGELPRVRQINAFGNQVYVKLEKNKS